MYNFCLNKNVLVLKTKILIIFKDNACLGFYNTVSHSWECEDNCLDKEGNQYCGKTGKNSFHIINFKIIDIYLTILIRPFNIICTSSWRRK